MWRLLVGGHYNWRKVIGWLCQLRRARLFHRAGPDGHLTLVAWIRRGQKSYQQCEFIAGRWNETGETRQYGLFLDIGVWHKRDTVFAHVSGHRRTDARLSLLHGWCSGGNDDRP